VLDQWNVSWVSDCSRLRWMRAPLAQRVTQSSTYPSRVVAEIREYKGHLSNLRTEVLLGPFLPGQQQSKAQLWAQQGLLFSWGTQSRQKYLKVETEYLMRSSTFSPANCRKTHVTFANFSISAGPRECYPQTPKILPKVSFSIAKGTVPATRSNMKWPTKLKGV